MKKYIILLAAILSFAGANAQFVPRHQLGEGFILTKEKDLEISGSPYLSENFQKGSIALDGKAPIQVYLRYDVQDEEMEIKTDFESSDIFKYAAEDAEYTIGDQKFVKESIAYDGTRMNGFFQDLYNGENLRLVGKAIANVSKAVAAKSSYEADKPARISVDQKYFVIFKDGRVEEVEMKRRDLRKVFDSKEAKEYLKDNDVDDVQDLVKFVEFNDKL